MAGAVWVCPMRRIELCTGIFHSEGVANMNALRGKPTLFAHALLFEAA